MALLESSPTNIGTIVDLAAGALRERIRSATRVAPQPVSLARELWRDVFSDMVVSALLASAAWFVARRFAGTAGHGTDWWSLVLLLVMTRTNIVHGRRYFIERKATVAGRPLARGDLLKPALGRVEYWCLITLVAAVTWARFAHDSGLFSGWLMTSVQVSMLNSATRSRLEFADAQKAIRLAPRTRTA